MIRCEAHAHTAEVSPCGHLKGKELARRVRGAGYDLLIVTDHYVPNVFQGNDKTTYAQGVKRFFGGYEKTRDAGEALGLKVLPGLEFSFRYGGGDHLVYGLGADAMMDIGWPFDMSMTAFKDAVNARGGVIYQAHPFRPNIVLSNPRDLDGVEVYNTNPRQNNNNDKALAFAQAHGLMQICGSDVHQAGDEGGAALNMPHMPEDNAGFVRLLVSGECVLQCLKPHQGL